MSTFFGLTSHDVRRCGEDFDFRQKKADKVLAMMTDEMPTSDNWAELHRTYQWLLGEIEG